MTRSLFLASKHCVSVYDKQCKVCAKQSSGSVPAVRRAAGSSETIVQTNMALWGALNFTQEILLEKPRKTHLSGIKHMSASSFSVAFARTQSVFFFPFVGSLTLLCLMGKEHTSYNISVFYYRDRIGQHNHNLHNMPAAVEKQSFQKKPFVPVFCAVMVSMICFLPNMAENKSELQSCPVA